MAQATKKIDEEKRSQNRTPGEVQKVSETRQSAPRQSKDDLCETQNTTECAEVDHFIEESNSIIDIASSHRKVRSVPKTAASAVSQSEKKFIRVEDEDCDINDPSVTPVIPAE